MVPWSFVKWLNMAKEHPNILIRMEEVGLKVQSLFSRNLKCVEMSAIAMFSEILLILLLIKY